MEKETVQNRTAALTRTTKETDISLTDRKSTRLNSSHR